MHQGTGHPCRRARVSRPFTRREKILRNRLLALDALACKRLAQNDDLLHTNVEQAFNLAMTQVDRDVARIGLRAAQIDADIWKAYVEEERKRTAEASAERDRRLTLAEVRTLVGLAFGTPGDDEITKVFNEAEDFKSLFWTLKGLGAILKERERHDPRYAPAPASTATPAPTRITVKLSRVGANVIGAIKTVREITSMGLKEAKELVDAVREFKGPQVILEAEEDETRAKRAMRLLTDVGCDCDWERV